MRTGPEIHEILIDDFVPVDDNGVPLFIKPHQNQIGFMLLEKARAKIYGSYENLFKIQPSPKEILE